VWSDRLVLLLTDKDMAKLIGRQKIKEPTVFVVVPVFNRLEFTKRCLLSLKKQVYRKFKIILVNDGSVDGTQEYIKKEYPDVIVVNGNGNWWWTKSMYEGVRVALKMASRGDFVLELNNDCSFGKNYLEQILATAKRHPNAIIGSLCLDTKPPGLVVESGIRIDWPTGHVYGVAFTISQDRSYYKKMEVVGKLDALPGKGTLIPVKVFEKIGNFRYKRLPHYIADYEFTVRAKRAGFDILVDTRAVIRNDFGATGIYAGDNSGKSLRQGLELMFSRRSMSNIVDWANFVQLACPKRYLRRNYWFIFCKFTTGLFSIYPFCYFKGYLNTLLSIIFNVMSSIRGRVALFAYVVKLKITQFPEYHLKHGP